MCLFILIVPPLKYFFDNIVFAPFIFIEDPVDTNGQRGIAPDGRSLSTNGQATPTSTTGLSILGKSNKIDPYYLIAQVCSLLSIYICFVC